jgi:cysteine desulfurase
MTKLSETFVYLDYNATTPVASEVVHAMSPYWRGIYGNPSSGHLQGRLAHKAIEDARRHVADLVGVPPSWVILTGGATEANNIAIIGAARNLPTARRHIIISSVEHPAIAEPAKALAAQGFDISVAPVDDTGRLLLEAFERLIRPDTGLVSIMLANNETGTIQPIAEVSRLVRGRNIIVHTDAAQAVGKVRVDVNDLGVDMLTVAGHKFYAPKGVGALIRDPAIRLTSLDYGAGHETGLRPGTENLPLIVGLGEAARLAAMELPVRAKKMTTLRDQLEHGLRTMWPGLILNGHPTERLPNTLNVSLPGVDAREILSQVGNMLAASAGSACHSDSATVSGVLGAMGIQADRARSAIRFSVGYDQSLEDIAVACALLADCIACGATPPV